ncbi:MAG: peptide ABC transporter substrate-binding protein [Verrucomicrobia bacterium]|nr:peptide ABC transporter substrate-binding protein [Verrucomicrobiota bacterium]MBU6446328.1 peptide ABC transporter substrate-binding protein [Verrucomicrobiota bacterium]MDE3047880.1 peptide ABC transporter substrate-binding protein [Verrucomicrobiota bacterium]
MIRIFLLCVLMFTGCQTSRPCSKEQILRVNIGADPITLDPRKARDLTSVTLAGMFFEGLMRNAKDGALEPALAESVETSNDGLQYRFHLRKSHWSNGDVVTSFDFAESWRTVLDPQFPTDMAYQLYGIKNAKKAKQGEISLAQVGIFTPDPQTLVVELEHPMPYFLQLLTMSTFLPVPHKVASKDANWFLKPETFVGNGPFLLKEWKHSDQINAIKNSSYWQQSDVRLTKLELVMMGNDTEVQMFQEGHLDWAGSPLSTMPVDAVRSLKAKKELCVSPFLATYFFRVNTSEQIQGKKNPLSSSSFRRALGLALERLAITDNVLQGGQTPAKGLVPPELGLSATGYFQDDAKQAQSLLTDALLELDLTLDKLEPIRISFASSERNAAVAQAVQQQLEKNLKIKVELAALEPKTYFQKVANKEYQLAAGSWTADFSDPINFLDVFKYKDKSTNNTNWESSKYIDLLNQSEICKDQKERIGILREAEQVLMEQMPIIPVFHFALNYLKRPDLEDVALSPLGKIDFRWAHVSTDSR